MVSVIIAAGGRGTRMGAMINKVYMQLCGREVLSYTIEAFEKNSLTDEIIVVTGENEIELCKSMIAKYGFNKVSAVTVGGSSRRESVYNGIALAVGDIIAIHDGARALISQEEINAVIADCKKYGAAAVGVSIKDTLKSADKNGFITGTVDREKTYSIHTPQVFMRDIIVNAHKKAYEENIEATDDCALVESSVNIKITKGSYNNIKLTTPEDMIMAENILREGKIK